MENILSHSIFVFTMASQNSKFDAKMKSKGINKKKFVYIKENVYHKVTQPH